MSAEFENLTPDSFLETVEDAIECHLTGFAAAFPSYINRVYELETSSGERLVAKFYRPNRWSPQAILEEHDFMWDCDADDIPVVPPFELANGSTLAFTPDHIPFAVFPKKRGREAEFESDESFRRVGALLGRIHACGARQKALHRLKMTPDSFAYPAMKRIFDSALVPPRMESDFMSVCNEILDLADETFPPESSMIRIHGDFHRANVLDRPGEGLMAIDFDDMLVGPPVQDLWLLLPDSLENSRRELDLILDAYSMFAEFDHSSLALTEILRAMRMMHFLSWCAAQSGDLHFHDLYPEWGTESFWMRELMDFKIQLNQILHSLENF